MRTLAAIVVAAVSFALTLAVLVALDRLIDFDLFSMMLWGFIPMGAFAAGLLAASGYYVGAVKLHVKPTRVDAAILAMVAGLLQVALYYTHYAAARGADGRPASAFIGFPQFVGLMLSHARYGLSVHGVSTGAGVTVGWVGYVLAVVQFVALVAGGLAVFALLADKPYCDACTKYLRKIAGTQLPFEGDAGVVDAVRTHEPLSRPYFAALRALPPGGSAALELELSACPGCGREALVERPMFAKNGKLEYQGDAYRTSWTTPGRSVAGDVAALTPGVPSGA